VAGLDLEVGTRFRGAEPERPLGTFGALELRPFEESLVNPDMRTGDT
jgi:hypothetical protein